MKIQIGDTVRNADNLRHKLTAFRLDIDNVAFPNADVIEEFGMLDKTRIFDSFCAFGRIYQTKYIKLYEKRIA